MDKIIDKEPVLDPIETMNTFKRLIAKREGKQWKKINLPCSLHDPLHNLTKDQLMDIYRTLRLRNLSTLKKYELVSALSTLVPIKIKIIINDFDIET